MGHARRQWSSMLGILVSFGQVGVLLRHDTARAPFARLRDTRATRKVGLLYARSGKEVPEKGWWGMNNYVLHLEKVLAEVVAQNGYDTKYM